MTQDRDPELGDSTFRTTAGPYDPEWTSLDRHPVPEWFDDAKLGIWFFWGVYSVPAWAPENDYHPYAEWYPWYMYQEGTEAWEHHRETYGEEFEYADFVPMWDAEAWDPDEWVQLCADLGAGYAMLPAEHHDGFPLWDTDQTEWNAARKGPERDLVGEFHEAIRRYNRTGDHGTDPDDSQGDRDDDREHGRPGTSGREHDLKFTVAYESNLNYYQPDHPGELFGHPDFYYTPELRAHPDRPYPANIRETSTGEEGGYGPGQEYVAFYNRKLRELIDWYRPDLIWFDTPSAHSDHNRAREMTTYYYNRAEQWGTGVVVNDRAALDALPVEHEDRTFHYDSPDYEKHGDYYTPEYEQFDGVVEHKWEAIRGLGRSPAYDQTEGPDDLLSVTELVREFVDVVSKNGNLLLCVGPRADGTIPELYAERLDGFADWLAVNGEAIYGTTYWAVAEDEDSESGVEFRYTWAHGGDGPMAGPDRLYAIVFGWPGETVAVSIGEHVDPESVETVSLLGHGGPLDWQVDGDQVIVDLPTEPSDETADHAVALCLDGVSNPRR